MLASVRAVGGLEPRASSKCEALRPTCPAPVLVRRARHLARAMRYELPDVGAPRTHPVPSPASGYRAGWVRGAPTAPRRGPGTSTASPSASSTPATGRTPKRRCARCWSTDGRRRAISPRPLAPRPSRLCPRMPAGRVSSPVPPMAPCPLEPLRAASSPPPWGGLGACGPGPEVHTCAPVSLRVVLLSDGHGPVSVLRRCTCEGIDVLDEPACAGRGG